MVCMDGFVLTHAYESVDLPAQADVDAFLPAFEPRQVLDPDDPVTIGAMVGPEAFTEVRYLQHAKQVQALDTIPEIAGEFAQRFERSSGGLVRRYRSEDADTVVVALGSVLGTIEEVVDELRNEGKRVGALGITCFRPWPFDEVRAALEHASRVVVLERAFAVGVGGIVGQNVRLALSGAEPVVHDVVAGLGGRPVTKASLETCSPGRSPAASTPTSWSSSTSTGGSSTGSCTASRASGARGRTPRTCCATSVWSRGGRIEAPADQVLPGRQLRRRQPAARPRGADGPGAHGALELDHLGPPRVPGMRGGARRALRARRCDASH